MRMLRFPRKKGTSDKKLEYILDSRPCLELGKFSLHYVKNELLTVPYKIEESFIVAKTDKKMFSMFCYLQIKCIN